MIRSLAVAALLLTACGFEPVSDLPPEPATPVQARPVELLPAQKAQLDSTLVRLQRTQSDAVRPVSDARAMVVQPPQSNDLTVDVGLEPAWAALTLKSLVAVPSCGWWPIASATAVASGAQAAFTFTPKEQGLDLSALESELFLFVDHDGDGACDQSKGDEVFQAHLGKLAAGSPVTVALADLKAAPYSCSLFSYLP